MLHLRQRHAVQLALQKLKFTPVLTIQGARQTGKSSLVRDILPEFLPKLEYASFDQYKTQEFANQNPGVFLSQHEEALPFVIDEAQKVPKIFDEIKYEVDQRKTPGKFILLGSTEFSKMTLIREPLTGRMSRLRLYPLNLAETLSLPENPSKRMNLCQENPRMRRADLIQYLDRGGMPGIFAVRNLNERESLLRDWLDLTTQRDLSLIPRIKIDIQLSIRILEKIATLEEPDAGQIARSLKQDLRRVKTHLEALQTLFVVNVLHPHPLGTGKPIYFLCDVSFVKILGGSFETQLYTWLLQEQLSQRSYRDDRVSQLSYYRTPKGSRIHLMIEDPIQKKLEAMKLLTEEKTTEKDLEILKALGKKVPDLKPTLTALGASRMTFKADRIEVFPWESLG